MKTLFTILLICASFQTSFAQKEAAIWYFGSQTGLDFNTNCQPTPLDNSQVFINQANAVISNGKTGQLQFYTNGIEVKNRKHQSMPNGADINIVNTQTNRGYLDVSQGALIVPVPARPTAYYLFLLGQNNVAFTSSFYYASLRYCVVDMQADNGLGDVVPTQKNIVLADGLASRLTAIPHANGRDYWVLTHAWNSNAFLVYPVTPVGIGKADTIHIGSTYQGQETLGFIKASPNSKKLACSATSSTARPFDLFDFDPATGKISNYLNLGSPRFQYGVSFSPDNTKLYVANQTRVGSGLYTELIRQYDLKAGDTTAIIASGKSIVYQNLTTNIPQGDQIPRTGFYAPDIELGPDGRIYGAADYSNTPCTGCSSRLLVINAPNEPGFACNVQLQTTALPEGAVGDATAFPNFMQYYFNGIVPPDCSFDRNLECTEANILLFPVPAKDAVEILITEICYTPYTLRLINTVGQTLAAYKVTTPLSQKLDVSRLPGGVYIAELQFADRTVVKRFVKQ